MEFRASAGEIERIDRALARIRYKELQLLRELAYQREELNALHIVRKLATSTLAPIHRLPNEVLGEIFLCGTEGPWDDDECDAFVGLVSLVSKRWYQVAIGTPAIWKRINLASVDLTILRMRLERSKDLSIDIYAEWGINASPQYIHEAMTLLCSCMHRWGSLAFRFVGITPFRDFLDVARRCQGAAPRLHTLSIMMDRYAQRLEHPAVPLNMTMPVIRHLQLDGVQIEWNGLTSPTSKNCTSLTNGTSSWIEQHTLAYQDLKN
ncbi:hypothetical protein BS47DRAFT_1038452 [Hydnum rufescens UP504]|uniref:F-box domain-containing protein n=1 Tax=Hydnum rufescens UP504 TaxID=1448309 RepID=A0A9P6AVD2_9AGAM|nr:hypothetical protein BS47DRAFT_1038452 [Hydnum rufescens UP504]